MFSRCAFLLCLALFGCGPEVGPDIMTPPPPVGNVVTEPLTFTALVNGIPATPVKIVGTLTYQREPNPYTVILCYPGATYRAETYFDFPLAGFSFAEVMISEGFAVAMINPVNVGGSGVLPGGQVNMQTQADGLTAAIKGMRARGYRRVILLGHSLGAAAATLAQSGEVKADALINTSFMHVKLPDNPERTTLFQGLIAQGEMISYLKAPGSPMFRASLLHVAGTASAVINLDNDAAVNVPQGWLADGFRISVGQPEYTKSRTVKGPVLVLCALSDALYPCSLAPEEGQFWPLATLNVASVEGGHSMALGSGRVEMRRLISEFIRRVAP